MKHIELGVIYFANCLWAKNIDLLQSLSEVKDECIAILTYINDQKPSIYANVKKDFLHA